eukprot:scaffold280856_cov15-Prasinocladus_malaysianus.AAC.1
MGWRACISAQMYLAKNPAAPRGGMVLTLRLFWELRHRRGSGMWAFFDEMQVHRTNPRLLALCSALAGPP